MGSGASKTPKQEGVYSKSRTHNKFSETQWKKEHQKVDQQKVQHQKVEHQKAVYRDILTEKKVNQNTSSETSRVIGLNMDKGLVDEEHVGESPTLNTSDHTVGKETGFNITEAIGIECIRHEVSCKESEIQPIGMVQNEYKNKELPNKDVKDLEQNEPDDIGLVNVNADNEGKSGGDTEADNENDSDADNENHPTKDGGIIVIDEQSNLGSNHKSNNDNNDGHNTETPLDSKIEQGNGDNDKVKVIDNSVPPDSDLQNSNRQLQNENHRMDENTRSDRPDIPNVSDVSKKGECERKHDNEGDDGDTVFAEVKTETKPYGIDAESKSEDSFYPEIESNSILGLFEHGKNKEELKADKSQPDITEDSKKKENYQNVSPSMAHDPTTIELSGRTVTENDSTKSQQPNPNESTNEESTPKATNNNTGDIESHQNATQEPTNEHAINKTSTKEDDSTNEAETQNGSIESQPEIPDDSANQDGTKITSTNDEKYDVDKQGKKPSLNDLVQRDNNKRLRANLDFYENQIPSQPYPGYKIEEMLRWRGNYDKLERNHQYIQWLFPMYDSSGMNFYAQPLQLHEAETIQQSQEMKARVLKAFRMMLNFYGMKLGKLERGEEPKFSRADDVWKERYEHLNKSIHNHLRITRIMRSIGYLGFQRLQYPWLKFILEEAHAKDTLLPKLQGGCIRYWIESLEDQDEQEAAIELLSSFDIGQTVPLGGKNIRDGKIDDEKKDKKNEESEIIETSTEANPGDTTLKIDMKEKSENSVKKIPNELAETSDTYSDEAADKNKESIGENNKTTESKSVKNENASGDIPRNILDDFVGAESGVQVLNIDRKENSLSQSQVDRNKRIINNL